MRVTTADILALYPTSADPLPALMIASNLTDVYFGTSTYSADQLAMIELNWACHILAGIQTAGGVVETRLGDTSIRYSDRQAVAGLNSTRFGEVVLMLDTDKILTTSQAAVGSIINVPLLRV